MATKKQQVKPVVSAPTPGPAIPPAEAQAPESDPTVEPAGIRMVDAPPPGFRECSHDENLLLDNIRRDQAMIDERQARIRSERMALQLIESGLSAMITQVKVQSEIWRRMTGSPGPGGIILTKEGKLYVKPSIPAGKNKSKTQKASDGGKKPIGG